MSVCVKVRILRWGAIWFIQLMNNFDQADANVDQRGKQGVRPLQSGVCPEVNQNWREERAREMIGGRKEEAGAHLHIVSSLQECIVNRTRKLRFERREFAGFEEVYTGQRVPRGRRARPLKTIWLNLYSSDWWRRKRRWRGKREPGEGIFFIRVQRVDVKRVIREPRRSDRSCDLKSYKWW